MLRCEVRVLNDCSGILNHCRADFTKAHNPSTTEAYIICAEAYILYVTYEAAFE
jgi:hypothetical protein